MQEILVHPTAVTCITRMVGLGWARRKETAHVGYAAPMGCYTLGSAYWSLVCYESVLPQRPPCTHTPAGQEEKFGWPPSHHKRRFICYQVDEPLVLPTPAPSHKCTQNTANLLLPLSTKPHPATWTSHTFALISSFVSSFLLQYLPLNRGP